jgi:hypothetical protein
MEAKGFVLDDTRIQLESACSQTVAASRVTTIKDGHIVFFRHLIDGCEEAVEVLLCVDIFFTVSTEENVFTFL